jgi:hypothetical protein
VIGPRDAAALGGSRPDGAERYGPTFGTAGFSPINDALAPGHYEITVSAWNHRTARRAPCVCYGGNAV